MRTRTSLLLLATLSLLALNACDTSPPAMKPDTVAAGTYPRNVALDDLDEHVVLGETIVTPGTDAKPLFIQQPVRNLADYSVNIQYRFQFFDKNKRPLTNTNQGWRFAKLQPQVEEFLEGGAIDTNAADWRLQIRAAR
jgi:hypothetical protein